MNQAREQTIDGFLFSTDKSRLDVPFIHAFISTSYWAEKIPLKILQDSIEHSLAFGIYENNKQVGFARVITDYSTFGYLADVFIDEKYRGRGLSKNLMTFIFSTPEFDKLRRFILATRDAHGLYEQFGFKSLKSPEKFMEIAQPDIYKKLN
jgi:N-acetylglutamate synthase-like GNAT family acetyltransferase